MACELALDQLGTVPGIDERVDGSLLLYDRERPEADEPCHEQHRHQACSRAPGRPPERAAALHGRSRVRRRKRHPLKRPHREKRGERHREALRAAVGRHHVHPVGRREDRAQLRSDHRRVHRVGAILCGRHLVVPLDERVCRDRARTHSPQQDGSRVGALALDPEDPRS